MHRVSGTSRLRQCAVSGLIVMSVLAASAHYVVAPGDTLTGIAQRHGITVAALSSLNQLGDVDLIRVGTKLALPGDAVSATASSPSDHATHLVSPGESVASIAADHGVSVAQIEGANGIIEGQIYSGTTLRLSGDGFVATSGGYSDHQVAEDDNLAHVASHHATTTHELAHANDLPESATVPAGTILKVPAAWACPVPGAGFFNDWGFPRSGGRTHTGTDLFAARGTPVVAPVSGVVEQVTGTAGGHQFVLQGDDANVYLGSHMEAFGADERVDAGTVIGYVGDSGNATGTDPHLHFQIHPGGGEATNPFPSLVHNRC